MDNKEEKSSSEVSTATSQPDQAKTDPLEIAKILEMGQVSLKLDTYDDIFSDFDPRPFSVRTLSDDFLLESKNAFREKESGKLQLRFILPMVERDLEIEAVINKRLKDHFKKHYQLIKKEFEELRRNSIAFLVIGFLLMLISTYISFQEQKIFFYTLLITVFEPTGWFLVWYGLDNIFYKMKEEKSALIFYQKMARTEITFTGY